jgi:hypothetical protein
MNLTRTELVLVLVQLEIVLQRVRVCERCWSYYMREVEG